MILGVDEVGRGPWAGPLVVGAVVLGGKQIDGLTDSKKLSKKKREELDLIIRKEASCGLGWVHADELDAIGMKEALKVATIRAVEQIRVPYHEIVIDGIVNLLDGTKKGEYVTTMKKADLLVPSVSAASIIAKVARDKYMAAQDTIYEGYNFSSHVGYGTAAHREAIEKLGVTPLHRLSFAPLAKHKRLEMSPLAAGSLQSIGRVAESAVAEYLQRFGHGILDRNWKTKYCEIDIVSQKNGTIYFTEVKYRRQPNQGGGLAAITPMKLNKMQFAAELYVQSHNLKNIDMLLAAAAVTGVQPAVEDWIVLT